MTSGLGRQDHTAMTDSSLPLRAAGATGSAAPGPQRHVCPRHWWKVEEHRPGAATLNARCLKCKAKRTYPAELVVRYNNARAR